MSGGDNAHVNVDIVIAAERTDFALLQHAQQLHLQRRRHIADFVQKQRASFRRLKESFARAYRAGKGATGVTEQLRLQQLLRQRAAVNGDKRFARARAGGVDRLRQHLFAAAALAVN